VDENPYQAPEAAVPAGKQAVVFRVIIAALVAVLGIATGALAVQHAGLLLRADPVRNIAMFGFPLFTTAAAGSMILAYAIASRRRRGALIGAILMAVGIGGWFLFLYGNSAGWFQ
jgi:hypothetical protein